MYSEGKTTGATIKADIDLTSQDVMRVGASISVIASMTTGPPPVVACGPVLS